VELKEKFTIAEIRLDSIIIKSSKSYRYIGKTKNYAFFYNKSMQKADAYPIDDAKLISITNEVFFDGVMMKQYRKPPSKQ
jgi:hypothetical protein